MEKTINMTVEEVKNQFYEIVNNSGLPFSLVYYLFKDFMNELTDAYNETLNNEFKLYQEEKEKEKEEVIDEDEKNTDEE